MLMNNLYYNKVKRLLVVTDNRFKPVKAYGGAIAGRKYKELKKQMNQPRLSHKDLQTEIELCKSVLLKSQNLPAELRAEYQKRYRTAKKLLEQIENSLIKS